MAAIIAVAVLCPHCRAELTEAQVREICASYSSSQASRASNSRRLRKGWPKGVPRFKQRRPPRTTKERTK